MTRVLIIDDDHIFSGVLGTFLSDKGYAVDEACRGSDGFQIALEQTPDLIMVDVNLPDSTGFQVCGRFRAHPVTEKIPIVMMTATARFPNQQKIGYLMGANEYLIKPLNFDDLINIVARLTSTHPVRRFGSALRSLVSSTLQSIKSASNPAN